MKSLLRVPLVCAACLCLSVALTLVDCLLWLFNGSPLNGLRRDIDTAEYLLWDWLKDQWRN